MSNFQIRTDVPMPGARNRYPFATMAAGTSFEIQGDEESRKVRNAAYQYAKKSNRDLAIKAEEAALGRKLTSDEKALVTPFDKNNPLSVEFALRKIREDVVGVDENGAEIKVPVFGLWRVR